jgi:polysaccharide export outer membrane protein
MAGCAIDLGPRLGSLPPLSVPPATPSSTPATAPVAVQPSPAPVGQRPVYQTPDYLRQGQPVNRLRLETTPNAAWRKAEIPATTKQPITVGRMPPAAGPQGYVIGPGDTVEVSVLGRPEFAVKANVTDEGFVPIHLVGAVPIAGLTPYQAAERIALTIKSGQYLVNPQVSIVITEYFSQQFSVLGEVRNPGRFPLRTRVSVLDVLALAGGISGQGSNIAYLLRPEDEVVTRYEIDLDALIQTGAGQQYFEILAGDTLVVPKAEGFYIYGEVRAPNFYPIKANMNVMQALSLAAGVTDKGSDKRIEVRRRQGDGQFQTFSAQLFDPIQAGDVLYVRERLF